LPSSESNKFTKAERLCRIKIIAHLFEKGDVFHTSLFKVFWAVSPSPIPAPAQVAFSVSKKAFRHAVSRNLAKRRMREAYRLNKSGFYEHLLSSGKQIVLVVVLKGTVIPEYGEVEKGMISVLDRLISLNPR
jgi:ribonuclease P protein component